MSALTIGMRAGKLTITGDGGRDSAHRRRWVCTCECGTEKTVREDHLLSERVVSCGCYRRQILARRLQARSASAVKAKHRRAVASWRHMIERCTKSSSRKFAWYGGRGIKVCDRWMSFENFLQDMGDPPPGRSIDRIDNNGNYEPSNCRWATPLEQANNRRKRSCFRLETRCSATSGALAA